MSAVAELRFGVARNLGLDPKSILGEPNEPQFRWRDSARFKNLTAETSLEQAGIASFGKAVAAPIASVAPRASGAILGVKASDLRQLLLASGERPFVALEDLLKLSWAVGAPVAYLRVHPWASKRMTAMTVPVHDRSVVLLSRLASYPAWLSFYLAHELAHISLGHVSDNAPLVDLERESELEELPSDPEEKSADAWAIELLTGKPDFSVESADGYSSAPSLAKAAIESSTELGVEPGTIALAFGHSSGKWAIANSALKFIYPTARPLWKGVNKLASQQLEIDDLSPDSAEFLRRVLDFPSL